jgi:rfaE bifunctional protein kinase chain/domain
VVLGDPLLDRWLHGTSSRLCREAPVPAIEVEQVDEACGGAANTAINLAALGAETLFLGPVGADAAGQRLQRRLRAGGVHDLLLPVTGRRTVTKTRIIVNGRIQARIDEGSTGCLPGAVGRRIIDRLRSCLREADALVIGDYAAGAIDSAMRTALVADRRRLRMLVVDAHEPLRWRSLHPALVTPSYGELDALWTRSSVDRPTTVLANADAVRRRTGADLAAVTLDVDGSIVVGANGLVHRTYAEPVPSLHTAGAGDVYTAAFTVALLAGHDAIAAADLAQQAATLATRRPGTCVCHLAELGGLDSRAVDVPRAAAGPSMWRRTAAG